ESFRATQADGSAAASCPSSSSVGLCWSPSSTAACSRPARVANRHDEDRHRAPEGSVARRQANPSALRRVSWIVYQGLLVYALAVVNSLDANQVAIAGAIEVVPGTGRFAGLHDAAKVAK